MQTAIASARDGSAASANSLAKRYIIAWALALVFYFLEYAARSSPAVMIPQLSTAFGATAVGVSAIIGTYYYTYSVTNLVAGVALDSSRWKMGHSYWSFCSGSRLLRFRRFQLACSKRRAITPRSGLCFRVHRSGLFGHAWIFGAAIGDGDRCDAMPGHVGWLGRAICCRADDSSRRFMANDLEYPGRGKSTHWLIALCRNPCWQAARVTAIRCAQLVTSALRNRLQQPAIVLMWTCGRSSFRAYNRWRDDLGSGLLPERSSLQFPGRGHHRVDGSAGMGGGLSAARLALQIG
jgi:hypothetical protein